MQMDVNYFKIFYDSPRVNFLSHLVKFLKKIRFLASFFSACMMKGAEEKGVFSWKNTILEVLTLQALPAVLPVSD
jgi:hypothetical protein